MKNSVQKMAAFGMAAAISGACLIQPALSGPLEIPAELSTQATVEVPLMMAPGADNGITARMGTAVVSGNTVNVRSGPSSSYSIIGTVKKGRKLTLQGSFANGWFKISYGNGYGYITGQYLTNISYHNDNSLTVYNATAVTTAALNVRKGNGTGYAKLGAIAKGTSVTITGKYANGWYEIKYKNGKGCVSGDYLKNIKETGTGQGTTQKPMTQPPVTSQTFSKMDAEAITTDALNVRKGNGTGYAKLGVLAKGASVTITGKYTNGWYEIKYKNGKGCVSGDYLKNIKQTGTAQGTTQKPVTQPPVTGQIFSKMDATAITTDALNVRKGNGTGYAKLGVLAKGTSVTITGKYTNGWYEIKYKNGKGCVSSTYLKNIKTITEPSTGTNPPSEPGMTAFYAKGVTTDNLNVRSDPSTKKAKIGTLPQGTVVGIVGKFEKTNWYKIVYRSGYGYVSGTYLKNVVQVDASGIYLSDSNLSLKQNASQTLALYSLFSQGKLSNVQWVSSNAKVASVSANGVVTGVSAGTAVITATDNASGKKMTCTVTVLNYKDSARISGVPNYNQLTSGYPTGCEQFSARMLVNYYGYHASTEDIVNAITLSPAPYTKNGKKYGGDPSNSFVGDPKKKKPYGYGCLPSAIVQGINRYMEKVGGAYRAKDISGCDIETIYSYISRGIPVIAGSAYLPSANNPVKEPAWTWTIDSGPNKGKSVTWWRNRHVMVVVGYDANYIYVNDPCFNTMQKFNKADWIADWNRVDRHTVVLVEK